MRLGTADAAEPQVEDGIGVRRVPLIAGEHQAGHLQAAPSGNGLCRRQVGPERGLVLPGFEAVVVGEGVRPDFLAGGARRSGRRVSRPGARDHAPRRVRSSRHTDRARPVRTSVARVGRWASSSPRFEANRNPTVAQVARMFRAREHGRPGPATARRASGRRPYRASCRATWSRTPQCSSKSREMTRAPGRSGMLTAPHPHRVAPGHRLLPASAGDVTAAPAAPIVVDASGRAAAHRTPWRHRRQR